MQVYNDCFTFTRQSGRLHINANPNRDSSTPAKIFATLAVRAAHSSVSGYTIRPLLPCSACLLGFDWRFVSGSLAKDRWSAWSSKGSDLQTQHRAGQLILATESMATEARPAQVDELGFDRRVMLRMGLGRMARPP